MSFLKSLDKKDAVEQISSTVNLRLTLDEDRLFTIASQNSGYSRNELTYLLLKRYIFDDASLKDMANQSDDGLHAGIYPNCYVVNTNIVHDKDDDLFMVSNGIAATFEDGYKEKMTYIEKGSLVFLYRSGEGIVAHGIASGEVLKKDHYGVPDKTYYQVLSDFVLYDKPLTPADIKKLLGRNIVFMHTWFSLKDGYKLIK